jgi:hypothetical protein
MASSKVRQSQAAARQLGGSSLQFDDLPVETMIGIASHLDFESFDNMRRVSRRLKGIMEAYWSSILPGIIEQELYPAEAFYKALRDVVSPSSTQDGGSPSGKGESCSPRSKLAGITDIHPVLDFCRAVRRWETEYHCLRFAERQHQSRTLRPYELGRLRQALYTWWRFAHHFHVCGQAGGIMRSEGSPALRCEFMLKSSTMRLHEAWDVWATICSAVERKVGPSVTMVWRLPVKCSGSNNIPSVLELNH